MSLKTKRKVTKADFALGRRFRLPSANTLRNHALICAALVPLATAVLLLKTPLAVAQDQSATSHVSAAASADEEQRFVIDSDLAISRMSLAMSDDPTGDVDRDFVALMIPHHQGAIDIARAELKYGHNEALRQLARDIVAEQEREVSVLRGAVEGTSSPKSTTPSLVETTSEHATSGRSKK